ncbi:hypothetical protein [Sphingomonas sp.]|uniref:hypothetical protein n=1 Tax=Sphingomonas sp. TaxID=28214 RepID=UPI003F6E7521
MKLADFNSVDALISRRNRLSVQLTCKLGVTIHGTYQEDDIVELVRPIVHRELKARIARIDAELVKLGVQVS